MMRDCALAILCGGRSQRLGTDKGLYQPLGDEPLVVRALRLWQGLFAEVLIVVHTPAAAALYREVIGRYLAATDPLWQRLRIVADQPETSLGPRAALLGVQTALRQITAARVIAVPVDQLGVRLVHLRSLQRSPHQDVVAFRDDQSSWSPFPSLWAKATAPVLERLIAREAYGLRAALDELGAASLPLGEYAAELAVNGNTPEDMAAYFGEPLFDPFKRRLHYLRFSLTEACNLSCTYCLPDGFPEWYRHKARLDDASIEVLLGGFRRLGFRKVRLTGGEPTVHPHCLATVQRARQLGYERIAMTTNGLLIQDLDRWVDAGLTDLNVSLDSLDPQVFAAMTKSGEVAKVIRLIERAATSPLNVKVNTVLMRSHNGRPEQIAQLIDWALGLPITLRFIELMDTGLNAGFAAQERVLGREIEPLLAARGLTPLAAAGLAPDLGGPGSDFGSALRPGRIGFINPLSCNFCSKCNRLRITAKGRLKLCLFGDQDLPLDLASPAAVALNVRQLIDRKPERHYLSEGQYGNVSTFRTIGG